MEDGGHLRDELNFGLVLLTPLLRGQGGTYPCLGQSQSERARERYACEESVTHSSS